MSINPKSSTFSVWSPYLYLHRLEENGSRYALFVIIPVFEGFTVEGIDAPVRGNILREFTPSPQAASSRFTFKIQKNEEPSNFNKIEYNYIRLDFLFRSNDDEDRRVPIPLNHEIEIRINVQNLVNHKFSIKLGDSDFNDEINFTDEDNIAYNCPHISAKGDISTNAITFHPRLLIPIRDYKYDPDHETIITKKDSFDIDITLIRDEGSNGLVPVVPIYSNLQRILVADIEDDISTNVNIKLAQNEEAISSASNYSRVKAKTKTIITL